MSETSGCSHFRIPCSADTGAEMAGNGSTRRCTRSTPFWKAAKEIENICQNIESNQESWKTAEEQQTAPHPVLREQLQSLWQHLGPVHLKDVAKKPALILGSGQGLIPVQRWDESSHPREPVCWQHTTPSSPNHVLWPLTVQSGIDQHHLPDCTHWAKAKPAHILAQQQWPVF